MKTIILQVAAKVLFPLLIIASLLSLFRGHNLPGGGFIGGLVASSAFILLDFAMGSRMAEKEEPIHPVQFIMAGLICALIAMTLPLFLGLGFFEAVWAGFYIPVIGRPGTPLLFDIGVYLVVIGAVCKIIFTIDD